MGQSILTPELRVALRDAGFEVIEEQPVMARVRLYDQHCRADVWLYGMRPELWRSTYSRLAAALRGYQP